MIPDAEGEGGYRYQPVNIKALPMWFWRDKENLFSSKICSH